MRNRRVNLRSYAGVRRVLCISVLAQLVYGSFFIAQTSFVVEGKRYYSLYDDGMISLRYATNWAEGHGPVWNPGDRVEGYTNFAWTALLTLLQLLPLSPAHHVLLVQIVGLLIWCAVPFAVLALARACRLAPVTGFIAALLATWHYILICYALMGMETAALMVVLTMGLKGTVEVMRTRRAQMQPVLWFTLAYFLRMDALIVAALAGLMMVFHIRAGWRRFIAAMAIAVAAVGGHLLWRHGFYGAWLPNTYYLKATGWPVSQRLPVGLHASWVMLHALGFPVLLALVAVWRGGWRRVLLAGSFLSLALYSLWVGGDFEPEGYRFVLPATGALMVLAAEGIAHLAVYFRESFVPRKLRVDLAVLAIIMLNAPQANYALMLRRVQGAMANRVSVLNVMGADRIADPQATAAVVWAGGFSYYSRRHCYDILGKNDAHIAHLPARPEVGVPGHNKYDLAYTLNTYRPDLVPGRVGDMSRFYRQDYVPVAVEVDGQTITLAVRRGSPHIHGGRVISWPEADRILRATPRY